VVTAARGGGRRNKWGGGNGVRLRREKINRWTAGRRILFRGEGGENEHPKRETAWGDSLMQKKILTGEEKSPNS